MTMKATLNDTSTNGWLRWSVWTSL